MFYGFSSKDKWLSGVPLLPSSVLLKSEQVKNTIPVKDMRSSKPLNATKPRR